MINVMPCTAVMAAARVESTTVAMTIEIHETAERTGRWY
jgi:hypothetical protein